MKDWKIKYNFSFTILNSSFPMKNSQNHHITLQKNSHRSGGGWLFSSRGAMAYRQILTISHLPHRHVESCCFHLHFQELHNLQRLVQHIWACMSCFYGSTLYFQINFILEEVSLSLKTHHVTLPLLAMECNTLVWMSFHIFFVKKQPHSPQWCSHGPERWG